MDDRGYIAQALFDRLRSGEVEFRVLGDTRGYPDTAGDEIDLAVQPGALRSMPRAVARFCHEFDLQLVQLLREAHGWHFVLAWSDDVGRPHFLVARVFSDFYVGARRLLRSDELLRASPDVRFIHGLATTVGRACAASCRDCAAHFAAACGRGSTPCSRGSASSPGASCSRPRR